MKTQDNPVELVQARRELQALLRGLNLYQTRLILSFCRELFGL